VINISAAERINRVVVTDIVGKVIYDKRPAQAKTSLSINKPGVYIISLTIGDSVIVEKLVVNSGF
jgi:hypothetical protein